MCGLRVEASDTVFSREDLDNAVWKTELPYDEANFERETGEQSEALEADWRDDGNG